MRGDCTTAAVGSLGGEGGVMKARRGLVLAATMMATFMAAVESTIVATAMPTIVANLGDFHLFSWVFAAYLLAQAVSVPIYGRLADFYGRKRVFFVGASLFLAGSTLCGFAHDMPTLIVCRALQGLGAGGVQPVAYTIIADIYTPAERARVQGFLSSVFGVAALVGPSLGALLVELARWPVVFWVNLPIGVLAMTMLAVFLRENPTKRRHRIDYLGAILLMSAGGLLMMALVQAQSLSPWTLAICLALGAAALLLLVWHERRVEEPILPLGLWRNRMLALACLNSFFIGAVMIGVSAFLPSYVQGVMGRSASSGGFALGAMSVSWALASIAAGRLMLRTSFRATSMVGSIALIVGGMGLAAMEPSSDLAWAAAAALVVGIGMGFCNTTYFVSAQAATGASARGSATSSIMFMRIAGQSTAAALFGAIVNMSLHLAAQPKEVVDRLMSPAIRHTLDAAEVTRLASTVGTALQRVFVVVTLLGVVVFVLGLAMPARVGARESAVGRSR
jgi:EmrB/QacA subfamily drug resistance transporter